jgi:hypothetical protein
MATTKRSTKGRAKARGAASTARSRAVKQAASAPKKSAARAGAKKASGAKAKPARPAAAKQVAAKQVTKKPGAASPEVAALKRAQREKSGLEKRLTEAAREIGLLRHHELRSMQLERQLAERDATIQRLQAQLADLERRPSEPVYVREIQQTLALGGAPREADADVTDVDEFEDDRIADDPDFIGDEE